MRIGIDFHSAERLGTGNCTYFRNLVENLLKIDSQNEYFLYVTNSHNPYYNQFKKIKNVRLRQILFKNPILRNFIMGLMTFRDQLDIFHLQYAAPPFYRGRMILMVHDISFEHFPKCFRKPELWRHKIFIPPNVKKAAKVLTVSEFSKNDIIKIYHVSPNKVEVTYNGLDPSFRVLEKTADRQRILEKYGIIDKFILFIGRIDVRKNIPALIRAFIKLKTTQKIPHQLVIAGREDFLPAEVRAEIKDAPFKNEIFFTGFVTDEELLVFYNYADVFVYPSLYEGFGLPVVEAMACGCPVITSNVSSLPEVSGDAAILINPNNLEELATAISQVISDKILRDSLKTKGLARSREFSWAATARKTLEVYREAVQ